MKGRNVPLFLGMLGLSVLGLAVPATSAPPVIADHDSTIVIDGDTIQIGGAVFQLSGIDAPELGQICGRGRHRRHCGLDAAYAIRKLITLATPPIACYRVGGTAVAPVASCVRGGEDLSLAMLEAGHVVAAPEGSSVYPPAEAPLLRRTENLAKAASMGIWRSDFVWPWEWRRQKETTGREGIVDPACVVKGKVTEVGERLYYGPLDEAYETLTVDPGIGDRLFCSDDQARAAGWRRAGQTAVGQ